jgi:tRNA (guanine-N7-)-methyltransferase
MRTVKSYVLRAGRVTHGQAKAVETLGPQFLLPYRPALITWPEAFGSSQAPGSTRPVVLEIGFGMGEATAQIAATLPGTDFLCCEVHQAGVGALLKRIGENGLVNIRICAHDAVQVIDHMLPLASLDGIHIFFPDPWHKTKHNKHIGKISYNWPANIYCWARGITNSSSC